MTQPNPSAAPPPVGELRALRLRLATARAGIVDLQAEWDATIELARYLRNRRRAAGQSDATAAVLADLQVTMRASAPVPQSLPPALPLAELQQAVTRAERDYDRLITGHIVCAAEALERDQA